MADVVTAVTFFADMTGLATVVAGLCWGFKCASRSMSIEMPGGSVCEGACIAAGVMAMEGCEQKNENGICGGAGYVVSMGVE
jgi:hypothetical protein